MRISDWSSYVCSSDLLPGGAGERRAHRHQLRAEQDHAAILQDQRDAEGEDELRVMPLALHPGGADAGHPRDQQLVDGMTEDIEKRGGEQDRDIGADMAAEQPLDADRKSTRLNSSH